MSYILIYLSILLIYPAGDEITGLSVGQTAPQFTAIDQFGKQVSLKESLESGSVILTFYRGAWCKYCMAQFKDYQDSLAMMSEKGATLIAVSPEQEEGVKKTTKISKATFSILHDQQLQIMLAYDVISQSKVDEYVIGYKKTGVDNQEKYLPVTATYIINQDGKIVFKYFDPNYRVRVPVSTLLEHL